ncbi:hypothetical protein HMP0721_1896 [Pseudoramibacter alactolyticus ATCC 23263]|uniref:Uncharacterized protein n=1 Tax=Pseudoramibacter alactolyticus ATCC 23263 TaxID=887929 RepID=E6MIR1_9FIRM|nr:hypothetical protein HMP0721_1896 [Pseudoramibacter alactolyticus ATCC 23263]
MEMIFHHFNSILAQECSKLHFYETFAQYNLFWRHKCSFEDNPKCLHNYFIKRK